MRVRARACLLVSVVAGLLSFWGCSRLFFQPQREHVLNPGLQGVDGKDVWIRSPDGFRLHGWLLHPNRDPLGTIVYFHGNAENISTHVSSVLWLVHAGYQILAVDYRGYGRSEGKPDMPGVHLDALATLDAAFDRADIDPDKVAVLGQSLGGAIAIYAVATSRHKSRVRLLIADSAPAGYRRIAREKLAALILTWPLQYPLSLTVDDTYSAERWIGQVAPVPVLILHGGLDNVVPESHAKILHDLAHEPKGIWIVRDAGHIQAFSNAELREHLLSLLSDVMQGRSLP
jgi:pimeloyl-ACP methyl ester carboxylesterase